MIKVKNRQPSKFFITIATLVIGAAGLWASLFVLPETFGSVSSKLDSASTAALPLSAEPAKPAPPPPPKHIKTPEAVKGIYMSQCVSGTPSFRDSLVKLIAETELNSVVIDIKYFTGQIAFPSENPVLASSVSKACGARDMREFVATLHEQNIYVIGRITVFQSPFHTKNHPEWAVKTKSDPTKVWHDFKKLSFVDVSARPYWDYIVTLSKEAYNLGFDELNYDYIRYPSDGPMSEVYSTWGKELTKPEALKAFYQYLSAEVKPTGAVISADLFGMTTTNKDDLNIGQILEDALTYFDYVAPMVYPSHYPPGFLGYKNPAAYPYEIVKYAMDEAVKRAVAINQPATKIRPWLQDFNLGAPYTPEMIKKQFQATYDSGLTSWLLWNAGNKYTRGALESEAN